MRRITHSCLSVRGALMNWSDQQFEHVFTTDDGTPMSAQEAKAELLEQLSQGREVIPLSSKPCEGFDYKGGGCPGHEVKE